MVFKKFLYHQEFLFCLYYQIRKFLNFKNIRTICIFLLKSVFTCSENSFPIFFLFGILENCDLSKFCRLFFGKILKGLESNSSKPLQELFKNLNQAIASIKKILQTIYKHRFQFSFVIQKKADISKFRLASDARGCAVLPKIRRPLCTYVAQSTNKTYKLYIYNRYCVN